MSDGLILLLGVGLLVGLQMAMLWLHLRRAQGGDAVQTRLQALENALAGGLERLERELREEFSRTRRAEAEEAFHDREERANSAALLTQSLTTQLAQQAGLQGERLDAFGRELKLFSQGLDERFERLRATVETRLGAIQEDNAKKLEDMKTDISGFKLDVSQNYQSKADAHRDMQTIMDGLKEIKVEVKEVGNKLDKKADKT